MSTISLIVLVVFCDIFFPLKAEAQDLTQLAAIPENIANLLADMIKRTGLSITNPPTNSNCSIQYTLYTPENPDEGCFIQPTIEDLNKCVFFPEYKTNILIHGFDTYLKPGNLYEKIKNRMLETENCNVIIVNWSKYGHPPVIEALANTYAIGVKVGEFINFFLNNTGINSTDIHIFGHSLGSHISGIAGKHVQNLGSILGSDVPATLFTFKETSNRLHYTDANFVVTIHTSCIETGVGVGFYAPIGSIDFYPNGGCQQPACQFGLNYTTPDGDIEEVKTSADMANCNHSMSLLYFLQSIANCKYNSTHCDSYRKYRRGECSGHFSNSMGYYAKYYEIVPPKSKFYLETSDMYPFCETYDP
ncbi:pancreatic triacylglycerol lipase [Nephila pilipes]|uniref:Pancreatic triacylglycerol lipase n=1 Tax=Nephila pilipes TaxID=299642 RepID=A0A8X6IQA2_NEPPI|nr:pancreatic triacylglycerol lipase [Nephila pilipes]